MTYFVHNRERTETMLDELLNVGLETVLKFLGLVARAKLHDNTSHIFSDMLELSRGLLAVSDLGTLVNGVEKLRVEGLDTSTRAGAS